jgi:hypothetical protein
MDVMTYAEIIIIVQARQRHYTENSKQIFPEMKLRGIVLNSYIHVSVSDLYIPTVQSAYSAAGK